MSSISSNPNPIKIALVGIGNCANALVQGIYHYRQADTAPHDGIMVPIIAECSPGDIEVVAAFDIDRRKVGLPLAQAIFAPPNCAQRFYHGPMVEGPIVQMSPIMDGVAAHMEDYPDHQKFCPADLPPVDIVQTLQRSGAELLVCYLPVGSEQAVRLYAEACLMANVAMINCVPVFIASDPVWADKFRTAGIPIIGDDIKSQLGATIVHRTLARLFSQRGCKVERTYQLNTGGNTDFLNMLARDRLRSKKKSKTGSVQSQFTTALDQDLIHIGPSDYVPWQQDNKVCFLRIEGAGFAGIPIELELRLSVQDSPNSAGVVIDAIRTIRLARQRQLSGPLEIPCAVYMKTPPKQIEDSIAHAQLVEFFEDSPGK